MNPAIAIISALSYGFLSYKLYGGLNHPKAEMYGLAALMPFAIMPYTMLVMMGTNQKLFEKYNEMKGMDVGEKATEVGLAEGESTKELLDRWGVMNVGRGIFPLVGAVLGLWTTLT